MSSEERFVWIDMETTGLSPSTERPLELGFLITDIELNEIDRRAWIIHEPEWEERGWYSAHKVDKFVIDMHIKSNLWQDVKSLGVTHAQVYDEVLEWCSQQGITKEDPLCGSSVQFDREWLRSWFPMVHDQFSYRNIDVSTVKELMKRLSPDIYATQPDTDYYLNRKIHRVMPDIEDTISEFKFYRKEFLYVPADFC